MSTTRIITPRDLASIVAAVGLDQLLDDLITRLVAAFEDHDPEQIPTFDRAGFSYGKPDVGLVEWMPAMDLGRRVSIKTVGYHPTNPIERGVPTILATTSLFDTIDGRLVALCEATFLTALRTGAASAIATDVLATDEPIILGLVGSGAQAVAQAHAISRVRRIERVLAFDANPDVTATLARRIPLDGLIVEPINADDIGRLVGTSDVICTATSVEADAGPVIPDTRTKPWLHVNAVGADFCGKRELPESLVRRALVCPDVASQCLIEGESQVLRETDLGPDLVRLVQDRRIWEHHRSSLTVFDSTGWALEDLVAAELVLDHAERLDLGIVVDLLPLPLDPYDPYEFVR